MIDIKKITTGKLMNGDSAIKLKSVPSNCIDMAVTDPPYGLEYDKYEWDKGLPELSIWKEVLRVLKPGGFVFTMCSPRQDLLSGQIVILQKAGFFINFSSLYWVYKNGIRHARNILKTKPEIANAKDLEGAYAGFQPKSATEVILVAMKPRTVNSYTAQAQINGRGVTFLDNCVIPFVDKKGKIETKCMSNLLVSDKALDPFWNECGEIKTLDSNGNSYYFSLDNWTLHTLPYLLVPKASKREKDFGLNHLPDVKLELRKPGQKGYNTSLIPRPTSRKNPHPMVKPLKLMAYLIALGSCPGDMILDPFCGSGTTCLAARLLGRKFIGIEKDRNFFEIAKERVTNIRGEIKSTDTSSPEPEQVHRLSELESFEIRHLGGPILDGTALKKLPDLINKTLDRLTEVTFEEDGFRVTPTIAPKVETGPEKTNVQDWADKTINVYKGCSNDCRYCYAREEAVRFNRVKKENWTTETLNPAILKKGWRLSKKNLMFPSTHDITPGTYDGCEIVLKKLLKAGNTVLVVSKPRPDLIEKLCDALEAYKKQILFRFTISAQNNDLLAFWEPNAPTYEDRKKALTIAHEKGFMTSVSIEPMLDPANVEALIEDLRPHTTDSMWVGTMNMIRKRVKKESAQVEAEIVKIITGQTPERLRTIYMRYQDDPMIKWKGHVRKALKEVGIKVPDQKDDWRDRL